ncbi:hypothetical protein GCM10007927_02720 [Sulfitobacter pacificus]|uniref:Uncharacterized protein n=1 Tax=Sulfitobacter pacificus TaxID=1499314 RepID=A0ABQ5VFA9_9RHOB|nr:hypothetical protein GCM10007927_02720 [Sulfitobacter pacificus]
MWFHGASVIPGSSPAVSAENAAIASFQSVRQPKIIHGQTNHALAAFNPP